MANYCIFRGHPVVRSENQSSLTVLVGFGLSHVLTPLSHSGVTMRQLDAARNQFYHKRIVRVKIGRVPPLRDEIVYNLCIHFQDLT